MLTTGVRPAVLAVVLCVLFLAQSGFVAASSATRTLIASNNFLGQLGQHDRVRRDTPLVPNDAMISGYMCRCTCFGTNSTVVPLPPPNPGKGGNPCSSCTKQFCLGLGLDMCKGAKAGPADQDTGTGFEGDVWARCFQKDSEKDYAVVSLYLLAVGCLLTYAIVRPHMHTWVAIYRDAGPAGVYQAVRRAPWRRSR